MRVTRRYSLLVGLRLPINLVRHFFLSRKIAVAIDTCSRYTSRHTVQKRNESSWDRVPSSCRDMYDVQIARLYLMQPRHPVVDLVASIAEWTCLLHVEIADRRQTDRTKVRERTAINLVDAQRRATLINLI